MLPLTKAERLKMVFSTLAHETFHRVQFENMIRHPDIGAEGIANLFIKTNPEFVDFIGGKEKLLHAIKQSWSQISSLPKLDKNSQIAQKAMAQYKGLCDDLDYYKLPTEIEAYAKEREFEKTFNLLI